MGARKIAYVVFVLPVVISVILGGYVLSNVLAQPDKQLNMWQFNFVILPAQEGSKDIKIVNLLNSYSISTPLNFTVRVNNTSFDCGDLYMTVYNLNTKQAVAQNAYFSQCFVQNNSTLPINEVFSPAINSTGSYQIVADMRDKSYQNDINVTATFNVQ
ncbi:MAG: hypothetical protein KGI08_03320 [Thaumarchaeota archaeon]|nr:hypothetical protein [Nitrososphaerota archaeon]